MLKTERQKSLKQNGFQVHLLKADWQLAKLCGFEGSGLCVGLAHCHPPQPSALCPCIRWLPDLTWDSEDSGTASHCKSHCKSRSGLSIWIQETSKGAASHSSLKLALCSLCSRRPIQKRFSKKSWSCSRRTAVVLSVFALRVQRAIVCLIQLDCVPFCLWEPTGCG
jgi:hypothetical protein